LGLSYRDTQCGFKLFGQEAARACFGQQKIERFAFDVELLWIAKKMRFRVVEVPVRWRHIDDSRVHPILDSMQMAKDALKIRWQHRKG
jgi:dolichyl-phosphate beta-glucosyltransferase